MADKDPEKKNDKDTPTNEENIEKHPPDNTGEGLSEFVTPPEFKPGEREKKKKKDDKK